MHIAMRWVTFLVALGLVFYFSKYEFGPFKEQHKGVDTLDGKMWYWPTAVRPMLERLGDFRAAYIEQEQTVDMIFPLLYGLMLMVPIVTLATALNQPRLIALLPLMAVFGDYVEDMTVIAMLKRWPNLGWLPNLASLASATKGVGLLASTGAIVVLAVMWIVRFSAHARAA